MCKRVSPYACIDYVMVDRTVSQHINDILMLILKTNKKLEKKSESLKPSEAAHSVW